MLVASCAGVLAAEPENKEGKAVAGKEGAVECWVCYFKKGMQSALAGGVDQTGKLVVDPKHTCVCALGGNAAKFIWWNTPRGSIEKVISPWTPVTLKDKTLGVWGREMEIGAAGIPARVSTQGKEVLAAPGRLVATLASGKELTAEGVKTQTRFDQDHRKIVAVESQLGDIAVSSEVRAEFDGLYKVTLTLTPKAPTAVKSLRVVLPYAEAMAEYLHAATTGTAAGSSYGFTPKGPSTGSGQAGRVWDSRVLGDKTMQVGSFIPYLWLGSTTGGLCWFADSDQGWIPANETPAIEIQRNRQGQIDLVFNLISSEATLDAPRTITFALQASPVKPMAKAWRNDNWRCGDPYWFCQASPSFKPSKIKENLDIVKGLHIAGRLAIPYFDNNGNLPYANPQYKREAEDKFPEKWLGSSKKAFCYGGPINDLVVFHISRYPDICGADGIYIDNVTPYPCDNLGHGCGYRLPDGRVQPTFHVFGLRECLLRIRAAFLDLRQTCKIVLPTNDRLIVPWIGAAARSRSSGQRSMKSCFNSGGMACCSPL